jgi:hypothetical protein
VVTPRSQADAGRPSLPPPPIDPRLVYPIDALRQWGIGARTRANLLKHGLKTMGCSKLKFFRGSDLIDCIEHWQPLANDPERINQASSDMASSDSANKLPEMLLDGTKRPGTEQHPAGQKGIRL